ncbi:cytochrome P450 [Anabaena catenula]|uniref:Cytochrome P450 n=1 Tax=Anabaena catenula FACHB-362 TaxID=2692877 RepID=A0ABR8J374_9NOST|nr:cytochrome P450 [Anabaena catenula]MBD2692113.1 cytochrome P450 [Anabaena catenula FACHB-362]
MEISQQKPNIMPYSFVSEEFLNNPYPTYAWLRENAPVYWSEELQAWVVSRYDDVTKALACHQIAADRITPRFLQLPKAEQKRYKTFAERMKMWMLLLDKPEHSRLRRLVSSALDSSVVLRFQSSITRLVDEMLKDYKNGGSMDFIADLASPLPLYVVSTILGIPEVGWYKAKLCAEAIVNFVGTSPNSYIERLENAKVHVDEMTEYLRGILHCRRSQPQNDFLSAFLNAEAEGQVMSEEEILATCIMIIFAGFETTMNLLGNGLLTLLRYQNVMEDIRRDPKLIPLAVREMLRYESPVQRLSRMALEDIEFQGQKIKKGDLIFLLIGSANRDPEVFSDPDTFNIIRNNDKQLAFGFYIHKCPGASLANMEGEIVFTELLRRFSHIRAVDEKPCWQNNLSVRSLKTFRIELTAAQ